MTKKKIIFIIIVAISILLIGGFIYFIRVDSNASLKDNSLNGQEKENVVNNILEKDNPKILVAYYSYTGNTKDMAESINSVVNGDLFEIKTDKKYSNTYAIMTLQVKAETFFKNRPNVTTKVDNMEEYDIVFVGYPIWWWTTPAIINSFLEEYDLSNKIVIPFCTSSDTEIERTMTSIRYSAKNSAVLDGLRLQTNDSTNLNEINNWLSKLGVINNE